MNECEIKMNEEIGSIFINQKELHARLIKLIKSNPQSFRVIAKDIGISAITLVEFIKGTKDTDFVRLCKIENYVNKIEQIKKTM